MPTPADTLIVALLVLLPVLFYYRDSLPLIGKPGTNRSGDRAGAGGNGGKGVVEEEGDPRDWLEQMRKAVSLVLSWVAGRARDRD
jgi:NADPH-ferrihemoprotein reductase